MDTTDSHNILSIGMLLLFWVWDDYAPAVKVILGVVTIIWLIYQLIRGLEKRREEKEKRREEKEKRAEEKEKRAEEKEDRQEKQARAQREEDRQEKKHALEMAILRKQLGADDADSKAED